MGKIKSIKYKLLIGGMIVLLVPIIILSVISITKSSNELKKLSTGQLKNIAVDLNSAVDNLMKVEVILANSIAADKNIRESINKVNNSGHEEHGDVVNNVQESLKEKFQKMGDTYQGIFVTDKEGFLFTGILNSGKEYRGSNIKTRGYFQKAKSTGKTVISDFVRSKSTKKLICVVCVPVFSDSNEFIGSVGLVIKVDFLDELISTKTIGKTGYSFMINSKGVVLAHPNKKFILSLDITKLEELKGPAKKMMSGTEGFVGYTFKGTEKTSGYGKVNIVKWFVVTTQDNDEFFAASRSIRNNSFIVAFIAIIIVIVFIFFGSKKIVDPINAAVSGLKDIAEGEGDLTMRLSVQTQDEVGELASWFNNFITKLQAIMKQIADNSGMVRTSADDLSNISTDMTKKTDETSQRSNNVAASTEEMNVNINSVAAAMEESSANLDIVASAAEEMTSTIAEISNNTENARSISNKAVDHANEVSKKVKILEAASEQINDVTESISDISEQTNLLALNATIEAARAGEAGKGFAVVANEIKELAQQTAQATQNIKSQITDIQQTTNSAVGDINQISSIIKDMNEIIVTIATAIEEQSIATKEISDNISHASTGIQEVNENINQSSVVSNEISSDISAVTGAVSDISSSSGNVKKSSDDLLNMAEELNKIVGSFKV
ncbi:MAG: methyl-accepting chemotaxis protein [Desulfobacterales bacterium]|nr:methyl-accepting chemotaxis protein [Desulfobacterales bacterium]MCP4161950.1 methyl-accepting chemotaxis protein [Deltaproteobacteria bacterium]